MNDDFDDRPYDDAPSYEDEYAALADPVAVMREVFELVEELRLSAKKLGDMIAAAGFPAREWVSADAILALLGEQFPDISLDAFLTRLAEFAAGMGPAWLHGGEAEIVQFNDEVRILHDVGRPLRVVGQRQRMLPPRERGDLPLERALADGRVGTQLDLVAGHLRDLDALAPYIVPLTPSEWATLAPPPSAPPAPQPSPAPAPPSMPKAEQKSARQPQPAQPPQQPRRGAGLAAQPEPLPAAFAKQRWLVTSSPVASPGSASFPASPAQSVQPLWPPAPAHGVPLERGGGGDAPPTYTRLRDFAQPVTPRHARGAPSDSKGIVLRVPTWRGLLALLPQYRWVVFGVTILVLSAGTGLLSLAALHSRATPPSTPISHLTATPASPSLTCQGRGATTTLTLRDTGTSALTWTLDAPSGVRVSATRGAIKPGQSMPLTLTATDRRAAHGTLSFTVNDGTLTVPYTITCP